MAAVVVTGRAHRAGRYRSRAVGSQLPAAQTWWYRRWQLPRAARRRWHPLGVEVRSKRARAVRAPAAPTVRTCRVDCQPRLIRGHDREGRQPEGSPFTAAGPVRYLTDAEW